MIDEFGGGDKIEGSEYCEALKTGSGIMTGPHRALKRGKGIKREKKAIQTSLSFLFFSFKSLPEGLQMTPLTTVEILTPLSAMVPRDGEGVRRPA